MPIDDLVNSIRRHREFTDAHQEEALGWLAEQAPVALGWLERLRAGRWGPPLSGGAGRARRGTGWTCCGWCRWSAARLNTEERPSPWKS
jgi:hypothetical protein